MQTLKKCVRGNAGVGKLELRAGKEVSSAVLHVAATSSMSLKVRNTQTLISQENDGGEARSGLCDLVLVSQKNANSHYCSRFLQTLKYTKYKKKEKSQH